MHGVVRVTYRHSKNPGRDDTHLITNDRSEARMPTYVPQDFYISHVPHTGHTAPQPPLTSVRTTDMHAQGAGFEIRKEYICAFALALVLVLGRRLGS
jgi:hypothetical protein